MQTTSNYSLKKPEGTDVVKIDDFNNNADIIDQQLNLLNTNKASLASPSLTGSPTTPTPTVGDNSTKIANTAFVTTAVSNKTSISGNAGTATKLQTPRIISLAGDVTGSTSFDGSGNASITATVSDDSHNHVIANIDGLQSDLDNINSSLSEKANNIKSYGHFGLSANQSVASVTDPVASQIVLNNTNAANTDLYNLSNGAITVLKDGAYAIEALVAWDINVTGFRDARILIGSTLLNIQTLPACTGITTKVLLYGTANLSANQVITLSQIQNSGSSLNILASLTYLKIRKIA